MELKKLKDQVIVITGASSGIGWSQRGWQQNGKPVLEKDKV